MERFKPARGARAFNCRSCDPLFGASLRFFGGFRRTRRAPGVVFFLGFGNFVERSLVGLLVDLRLFRLFGVSALRPLALHLGVRRQRIAWLRRRPEPERLPVQALSVKA